MGVQPNLRSVITENKDMRSVMFVFLFVVFGMLIGGVQAGGTNPRGCWKQPKGGKGVWLLAMGANTGKLKETSRDVTNFANAMRKLFKVKWECRLPNVHKAEFTGALKRLRRVKKSDLVIIYYSGLGGHVKDKNGDEKKDDLDEVFITSGGAKILDDDFSYLVKNIPAKNIWMVIDTCFSAGSAKGKAGGRSKYRTNPSVAKYRRNQGALDPLKGVLFSAAGEKYKAMEVPKYGGRFTLVFLKKLYEAMKRGHKNVNLLQVFKKTRAYVWGISKRTAIKQKPEVRGQVALLGQFKRYYR